ncbi:MAG: RNA methyltransferase [Acidobacteriota bacterium]
MTRLRSIRSRSNPLLVRLCALARSAERRSMEGVYLAEGVRWAREAISDPEMIAAAVVSPRLGGSDQGCSLRRRIEKLACPCYEIPDRLLDAVAESRSPQGVILVMRRPPDRLQDWLRGATEPCGLWVVSAGIQDPGNLGGLVRTAWAFGAAGFLCHGGVDLFHPRAVRASAGALLHLPVGRATNEKDLQAFLGTVEARAAVARGGKDPRRLDWRGRCALIMGSEAHGLPAAVESACAVQVSVPMRARCHSLNVGAAAAALLAMIGPEKNPTFG